jgi:hypothetical protein
VYEALSYYTTPRKRFARDDGAAGPHTLLFFILFYFYFKFFFMGGFVRDGPAGPNTLLRLQQALTRCSFLLFLLLFIFL